MTHPKRCGPSTHDLPVTLHGELLIVCLHGALEDPVGPEGPCKALYGPSKITKAFVDPYGSIGALKGPWDELPAKSSVY